MAENNGFDTYALVELFGHQKIAGRVTEQVIAGQGFVRVDVPETSRAGSFTRLFGPGAIYSITPISEELVKQAAERIYVEPVTVYIPSARQIEAGEDDDE